MTLRFELTVEDLVAFSVHVARTNPYLRQRQRRGSYWMIGGLFLALLGSSTAVVLLNPRYDTRMIWVSLSLGVPVALAWALLARRYWISQVARTTRKMRSDPKAHPLGRHVVQVTDTGLDMESETVASKLSWKSFRRVELTDEHVFLLLAESQGAIFPKMAFDDEAEFSNFVAMARERIGRPEEDAGP